jgi:hypothetical protein
MPSDAREARRAGTLSAIVVLVGETAGLHTCQAENPFEYTGWILFHPCFLTDPPIFAETFFIASRQGGIDGRWTNSANKTIDSKGNSAKTRAGG